MSLSGGLPSDGTDAPSVKNSSPQIMSISLIRQNIVTVEKLRERVRQVLKCVINLHIDILVLESNVNQLIDECKEFNADLLEVDRLDKLISTLRDYNGPTICHEWPYPLLTNATIDEADIAQTSLSSSRLSLLTTVAEDLKT
ncbi:uncharacterized protein LOC129912110 [Episyrphus balteatus]|uniref:uncharacterized protein LOC129912110 n=1 Tax=Episyrphus balteatus TaxID=286459 RepID=UPI0024869512|nr:uncharacterized protein LOC129912110 [Episyrphus balteatus]